MSRIREYFHVGESTTPPPEPFKRPQRPPFDGWKLLGKVAEAAGTASIWIVGALIVGVFVYVVIHTIPPEWTAERLEGVPPHAQGSVGFFGYTFRFGLGRD